MLLIMFIHLLASQQSDYILDSKNLHEGTSTSYNISLLQRLPTAITVLPIVRLVDVWKAAVDLDV